MGCGRTARAGVVDATRTRLCLPKTSYARFAWPAGVGPGPARAASMSIAGVHSSASDGRIASFRRCSDYRVGVHGLQVPAVRGGRQAAWRW